MLGALSMIRSRVFVGFVAACLAMAAMAQDGIYYKWTDASGTVHFSATPPPGHKAETIKVKEASGSQAVPAQPLPPTQPTAELEQAQAAYRQRSCAAARSDLKVLEQGRLVVSGSNPDAATKLDAEQRAQAKVRATQRISQFCEAGAKP
ncbi:MAG: DUF4124 domain-containing protein [Frateuria sp.]|nr:DUF4124 domain-containing protein [Frateuria sp.]